MELEKNKATISFKRYRVTNVELKAKEDLVENIQEIEVQLGINPTLINNREFNIDFKVSVNDKKNNLTIEVNLLAEFLTDEDIDDKFIDSSFVKINAPAIVFPYIRSFITNLSVNSGYNPIILPTLNFAKK
jgi:preprotein translocase subunit SecB